MEERRVYYLDNNATTVVAPEVFEAMKPYFQTEWGNPSSAYFFGHHLSGAIQEAREKVAALIYAEPREVVSQAVEQKVIIRLFSARLKRPANVI